MGERNLRDNHFIHNFDSFICFDHLKKSDIIILGKAFFFGDFF